MIGLVARTGAGLLLALTVAPPLAGQSASPLELGRAAARTQPGMALRYFEQTLAVDSLDYEANWRAAVAAVEFGQETPDSIRSLARDSLYLRAVRYARRAVRIDSTAANGYFALAMALGRSALSGGERQRLDYAALVHSAAMRAHELDPRHDGVHHVLGLWNAEVMRTSGLSRFMARNILGAKVLGQASWANALHHLERAVALDPERIYHRLDLARVYADRKRYAEALAQLDTLTLRPDQVALDPRYRAEGMHLRERITKEAAKRDGGRP